MAYFAEGLNGEPKAHTCPTMPKEGLSRGFRSAGETHRAHTLVGGTRNPETL